MLSNDPEYIKAIIQTVNEMIGGNDKELDNGIIPNRIKDLAPEDIDLQKQLLIYSILFGDDKRNE